MGITLKMPGMSYTSSFINYSSILNNIAQILPLIIGVVLLLTFLRKENANKYTGFAKTLYDFLTFKTFCFKKVLEVIYLFTSLYYTVYGALCLFINPALGLIYLVVYNVIVRLVFEFFVMICKIKENSDKVSEVFGEDIIIDEFDPELDDEELDENVEIIEVVEEMTEKPKRKTKKVDEE